MPSGIRFDGALLPGRTFHRGRSVVTTTHPAVGPKHRCYRLFRGYHRRGLPARAAGHRQAHPGRSRRHWLQQQRLLHHLLPQLTSIDNSRARDRPHGRQADDPPFKPRIRCGKDHLPAPAGWFCGIPPRRCCRPQAKQTFSLGNTAQFPPSGLSTAPAAAARHLRCQNAR